jgi:hypothetical protein
MTELTKTQKIQELVDEWIEGADTESIFEYAAQKLTEWYEDKEEEAVNKFYQEMLDYADVDGTTDWFEPTPVEEDDTFHNDMFEVKE